MTPARPKPPLNVLTIATTEEFWQRLQTYKDYLLIVEFFADWCVPCKQFKPIFDMMPTKYAPKGVVLTRINSETLPEIAQYFNVMGVPSMLFLRHKQVLHRHSGAMTRAQFEDLIQAALIKFGDPKSD